MAALALLESANVVHASEPPEDFSARQKREIAEFRKVRQGEINAFRDSVNREYAGFIEAQWEQMRTLRNTRSFTPPPLCFAPRPSDRMPKEDPHVNENIAPDLPEPETPIMDLKPEEIPDVQTGRQTSFYGRDLTLYNNCLHLPHMRSANSRDVADYWRALSSNMNDIIEEFNRIENEIGLDDWGVYRLAYELAPCYINGITPNERVVFSVFVLSQRGLKCKMAENNNKLYPLLASKDELFNTLYIEFSDDPSRYYVITRDFLDDVNVCTADFRSANRILDFTPPRSLPHIGGVRKSMNRKWTDYQGAEFSCSINYDPNLTCYLSSYPCIDFKKYAEAPIDDTCMNHLNKQLNAQMENMDIGAKLNHLLHFVQFAFDYKTDDDNYGYEKWNFPDETLVSDFCDCDDRAILWCRLVRDLVGVKTALVLYPGQHLAAAASIEAAPGQTSVKSGGCAYVLCDPTYIGADIGMEMPSLVGCSHKVIPLF